MARIRTIKPDFWTDEKVVAISPLGRLLFIGMWNFVDDEGRAEFSPMRLKMQILPADSADMSELLGEIQREKLISVYEVDGKEYFQVSGFSKHQKVDKRTPSKLPPPPDSAEFPRSVPTEGKGREEEKEEEKEESAPNGAARDFQKSVQPRPAQKNNRDGQGSDEDLFWARAGELEPKGVSRSRCGQLANLLNGDFAEGLEVLRDVAGAKEPSKYLGAIIRNRRAERRPAATGESGVPDWVSDARGQGYAVTREGERWRMAGALYDDRGEQVGC